MTLPEEFIQRMKNSLGEDEFSQFLQSLQEDAPVSIRIHPKKIHSELNLERVTWSEYGYYLPSRPVFSSDPAWHSGWYYVQEAGSMRIEKAFRKIKENIKGPLRVLDLCASPGGKSSHLAHIIDEEDVLVANETIKGRVGALRENLMKNGYPNIVVTNADSSAFLHYGLQFDVVLADVPCSGEGLFRKDPLSIHEWSAENISLCELRQKRILENVIQIVKPGGYLIYSTCTYNPGENEEQVKFLENSGFSPLRVEIDGHSDYMFHAMPHQNKSEGFFMAVLQNTGNTQTLESQSVSSDKLPPYIKQSQAFEEWLNLEAKFIDFKRNYYALTQPVADILEEGLFSLATEHPGILLASSKEKYLLPASPLAMSLAYNHDAFKIINLNLNDSLQYLNLQAVNITEKVNGLVQLQYEGIQLGFAKGAGTRLNNRFPKEWRLRNIPAKDDRFSILNYFSQ